MLLCTITYDNDNGDTVTRYASNELAALTNHQWRPFISSAPNIKYGLNRPFGGMVTSTVSEISVLAEMFAEMPGETGGTWPPPATFSLVAEYSDTDDGVADKIKLFEVTGHIVEPEELEIKYNLFGLNPTYKVRSLKIEQSLQSLFEDFAAMWNPDYTLTTTYASNPSSIFVDVLTPATETLLIDILADICEFHQHFFEIDHENETINLVSMAISRGPAAAFNKVIAGGGTPYRYPAPVRSVTVGDSKLSGLYAYGQEIALNNICVGEAFLMIGDNSGNDEIWIVHNGETDIAGNHKYIPYDQNKLYRYTLRYRKKTGTHTVYGGFHCMSDLSTSVNTTGADSFASQHYIFSRPGAADDTWHSVTGYLTGAATNGTLNVGAAGTTITGTVPARTAHQDTAYIRPLILVNHDDAAGRTDIAYCAIHEIEHDPVNGESDGGIIKTLFEYNADHFDADEWDFKTGSAAIVSSSTQSMLDYMLASSSKPVVELRQDLTVANLLSIGQQVVFTDDHSQYLPLIATFNVREINYLFNLEEDEMVVVGEGTIA